MKGDPFQAAPPIKEEANHLQQLSDHFHPQRNHSTNCNYMNFD